MVTNEDVTNAKIRRAKLIENVKENKDLRGVLRLLGATKTLWHLALIVKLGEKWGFQPTVSESTRQELGTTYEEILGGGKLLEKRLEIRTGKVLKPTGKDPTSWLREWGRKGSNV